MVKRLQSGQPPRATQRGVALAVSLILLLLLTIIGITAMRSSIFESQMARNEQARIDAFQQAQSILDGIISDLTNLSGGNSGDTNCTANVSGCNTTGVILPTGMYDSARTKAVVTYLNCVDSVARGAASGTADFDGANFSVEGTYDSTTDKRGRSSQVQGVMMLIRQGSQSLCK